MTRDDARRLVLRTVAYELDGGNEPGWVTELADGSERAEHGRVPLCNGWRPTALCMRYWGLVPGAYVGAGYGADSVAVVGGVTARLIDALPGAHLSWQPEVRAVYSF